MSVKKIKTIKKACTVVDEAGNKLGVIEVEEVYFRWTPNECDGWSTKEIETMYQDTVEYRVDRQCMKSKIIRERK